MTRARLAIGVPCIVVGLISGFVGGYLAYTAALEAGFSGGAAMTIALAGFAPPVAIFLVGGVIASRRITNAKRYLWADGIAAEFGVHPERMREMIEIFD